MDRKSAQQVEQRGRPVSALDAAMANDHFELFLNGSTLKAILGTYRSICDLLHLKPNIFPLFYPKLRSHLTSWRAKALWKKFDLRANNKVYGKGKLCPNTRVLIIGAGPCGLRTAIEAQLLGAKVVVVEKRDRMSRNNVLHLWPFVIDDLRSLGAKKFFGKFCAGAIDHISIRQLQCILLKVALLLGVEVHTEVSFEKLIEPSLEKKTGWTAEFKPIDHPVSQFEFDVIIGADGKRNTLQGFKRKEFRGKLAIAITANFINKRTEAEAMVEEISGVAFIFNQKFFKDLQAETGIDLENIVYYKDDTHYFVMTAKKQSLIEKGVIKQDLADTAKLLAPDNVDRNKLMNYAREAAEFSTNYKMLDLEFAVNHYGQPDVAMFDFTSMYAAENASRIIERHGYKLMKILVGDSLLEPFWPTGSGCARGFLSSLDASWAIRGYGTGTLTPLEVIAERESIYRLLAQTTPENLNKDYKGYTLDPSTRYPNLNKNLLLPQQVLSLYDTDDPNSIELARTPLPVTEVPKRRRKRESHVDPDTLLAWIKDQIKDHPDLVVSDITISFKDGRILCAIINHYRPDLLDYNSISPDEPAKNNQIAFDLLEKEIGIPPIMTGEEMAQADVPDFLTMVSYLTQIYDIFRCEIPHIKHPKLDLPETKRTESAFTKNHPVIKATLANQPSTAISTNPPAHRPTCRHKRHIEPPQISKFISPNNGRSRKRKSMEKTNLCNMEERMKRLEEISQNRNDRHTKRRQQRKMQTDQFIKSMQMLQANCKPDHSEPFEDYSIYLYRQTAPNFEDRVKDLEKKFTYVPDRDKPMPLQTKGEKVEDLKARIKGIEEKWQETVVTDTKPKDLLRAIGKIDNSDWNIREIEKKIIENKLGKNVNKDKEKVPKWSREQFLARQTKMEKQHLERQDSAGGKFAEIDKNIKQLDLKLKEGTARDVKKEKVQQLAEKLKPKTESDNKPIQKSSSKTIIYPTQGNSETCHFCDKRVYLMERLSAEGRFFHRGCFRCQYCGSALRLGSYMYDRDGKHGYRFYCSQHFGLPGELKTASAKVGRKLSQRQKEIKSPEKKILTGVSGLDLLDRVQTPERIEFSNLSVEHISSDNEESLGQIDEDEWTDRNLLASTAATSDDDSSSFSDTDSDDEDAYEEALEEPATKEGTLRWAERYNRRYSRKNNSDSEDSYSSSDHSSYYENSSGDDDTDTATEGEEEIRARELRKQEVRVDPPVVHTDTGTDTEIASDDSTSDTSSEVQNSATEISTDSEFAHDDPTPTREIPPIALNDKFVTKTRGKYKNVAPQKVQIKTKEIQKPVTTQSKNKDIQLTFTPLVQTQIVKKPAQLLLRSEGYALNRTQSTGGIATKVSLELKKKYLLGESSTTNSIQKSGSASTLDSKFKSFHSNISDCQKLLKPAPEISASMQTFCNKLNERTSPISPLFSPQNIFKDIPKIEEGKKELKESPEKNATEQLENEKEAKPVFENVNEGRPRSPVHETSIIVPQIDWSQNKQNSSVSTSDSDSSSTSCSDVEVKAAVQKSPSVKAFVPNIPTLEIQDVDKDLPLDSLNVIDLQNYSKLESQPSSINEPPKSISSDKKVLNQPKALPKLENDILLNQVHTVLHNKKNDEVSGRSTPSNNDSCNEQITAALTETELSDWARDEAVSDDFEDADFELNSGRKNKKTKPVKNKTNQQITKAAITEIDDLKLKHVCGKVSNVQECLSSILHPNLDNIEFMDTGTESSDDGIVEAKNNGYVQFQDEDDILEDSLSPVINVNVLEVTNPKIRKATFDEDFDDVSTITRNTGYCIIENDKEKNPFGGEVIDLKPTDLEKLKEKRNIYENEEDSLLIIEPGTTTEENTCSDSTVKNVTELVPKEKPQPPPPIENNNTLDKKRLEDKLAQVKKDMKKISEQRKADQIEEQNLRNNIEFEQHCQRLQSKVEFGNAKDSIDIRKSRRHSKSNSPPKPDLIQEEKELSPLQSRKEQIEKERDLNKKLVEEMVMNKMKAQNKSLERKKRTRNSFSPSPSRPYSIIKSATTCITTQVSSPTPDVLLSTMNTPAIPVQKSMTVSALSELNQTPETKILPRAKFSPLGKTNTRPLSVHASFLTKPFIETKHALSATNSEAFSLPDIHQALTDDFKTPKAPPRYKNEEARRTVERLKEDARARARLLSDEELGLSPEDKLAKLRQRVNSNKRGKENEVDIHIQDSIESLVTNRERRNSLLYSNDTLNKKKNSSFRRSKSGDDNLNKCNISVDKYGRERTKSVSEVKPQFSIKKESSTGTFKERDKAFKSDPNLLQSNVVEVKKDKKKGKDRERRKSITKMFTDLFGKKKDSGVSFSGNKGFLSRLSPKTKDKSKSCIELHRKGNDIIKEEPVRQMSFTDMRTVPRNVSPPPIPPLPLNYTGVKLGIDDSSDAESEWKLASSCDTLDQSGLTDGSTYNRRSGRSAKRAARQSQLKRHRMAQEVQRKLEETEVKTRELEQRGVCVEKALRGESTDSPKEETELLKEWFDLMRDMTELRRYERELLVRAQELELEDRHARLQHELKERLENEGEKTQEDVETEGSIIREMMNIVKKRDSLIALLEEDRQRYSEEDKGFEEQMLVKGIKQMPIMKVVDK